MAREKRREKRRGERRGEEREEERREEALRLSFGQQAPGCGLDHETSVGLYSICAHHEPGGDSGHSVGWQSIFAAWAARWWTCVDVRRSFSSTCGIFRGQAVRCPITCHRKEPRSAMSAPIAELASAFFWPCQLPPRGKSHSFRSSLLFSLFPLFALPSALCPPLSSPLSSLLCSAFCSPLSAISLQCSPLLCSLLCSLLSSLVSSLLSSSYFTCRRRCCRRVVPWALAARAALISFLLRNRS